jgi:hypothetical protein
MVQLLRNAAFRPAMQLLRGFADALVSRLQDNIYQTLQPVLDIVAGSGLPQGNLNLSGALTAGGNITSVGNITTAAALTSASIASGTVAASMFIAGAGGYTFSANSAGILVGATNHQLTFYGYDGTLVAYFEQPNYTLHTYDINCGSIRAGVDISASGNVTVGRNINAAGGYRYVAYEAFTPATRIPANGSAIAGPSGGQQCHLPYAGSLIAVTMEQGDAGVFGTLTATPVLNGVDQPALSATIASGSAASTVPVGQITFGARSQLWVRFNTSNFSCLNGNITVQVYVSA